jgi:gluconokinase
LNVVVSGHFQELVVMVIVLMGVSGTGKTTIGKVLAVEPGWTFVEGDDFHPAENVEKMNAGIPLNDEDRWPWLQALRTRIDKACERGENVVLACSALKEDYREYLEQNSPQCVHYVYLHGPEQLIRRRLAERKGHFMDPALLQSQFQALEPPVGALRVDITPAPEAIAAEIRRKLGL